MFREFRLKKIRIEQQDKLNSRNLALYKVITNNIQNSDLRSVEKEEILQDVLDMMLQVQIEDKPVETIVGDDYREFCKSIVDEYLMSKPNIYKVLSFIQKYIILISIISFAMITPAKYGEGIGGIKIPINAFIYANAIVLFIIPFARKARRKSLATPIHSYHFGIIDNERGKVFRIWLFIFIGLMFINTFFSRVIGINLGNYYIYPFRYISVIAGLPLMVASIEIYKRVYDKR